MSNDDQEKVITADRLEIILGRLENKIDAKFNAIDAQRLLAWATIAAIIAQIANAWIIHLKCATLP
jgi:hypothetical protein